MRGSDLKVLAVGGTLLPIKVYAVHKYLQYRKRRAQEREGYGIGPKKFQALSRHRQREVLYYKRGAVRELEKAYHSGDWQARQQARLNRRRPRSYY